MSLLGFSEIAPACGEALRTEENRTDRDQTRLNLSRGRDTTRVTLPSNTYILRFGQLYFRHFQRGGNAS